MRQLSQPLSSMILTAAVALAVPGIASASNFTDVTRDSCTDANCGATVLNGAVVMINNELDVIPFTASIYTSGGECVRLEVLSTRPASRDLTMHLLGPSLEVWRDDDSGVGLLPRIEANTTTSGRYTVQVSHFGAAALANTNTRFSLSIGRCPLGNPNCAEQTFPLVPAAGAAPESKVK